MNEHREMHAGRRLTRDLEALRAVTARDVPRLEDTASALIEGASPSTREGWLMKSTHWMKARPMVTTALATVVLAAVMLVVPISYQRTVGQDVKLAVAGTVDPGALKAIAKEFKTAVGAAGVQVSRVATGSGITTTLFASSNSRSGREIRAKAAAFAKALGERGIHATAAVTPRRERVSTNLYAYAADQVVTLHIDRTGKTPQELEADIRSQLAAAGLPDANVSVTENGDQTQVRVEAHADQSTPSGAEHREFRINLDGDGAQPMDATLHQFTVDRRPGMTDDEVKAEIEQQMRDAGVTGTVTVQDGQVKIEVAHDDGGMSGARAGAAGANPETKRTTWGEVKAGAGK